MKISSSICLILCLGALSAFAATEEKIHETRSAKPAGKIVVDVDFANDKVVVDAYRKVEASSKEKEEEYLSRQRKGGGMILSPNEQSLAPAVRDLGSLTRPNE